MSTRSQKWERRRTLSAWALLPLIFTLARPAGAEVKCYTACCPGGHCSENDCAEHEKCENGECRPQCGTDGMICEYGLICLGNICTNPQCALDSDCDGGGCNKCKCEPKRECTADGGCNCTSNGDCDVGFVCSMMGVCQAPVRAGPALEPTCAIARGQGTASIGPLAALLLAGIALGARCQRRS